MTQNLPLEFIFNTSKIAMKNDNNEIANEIGQGE